MSLLRLKHWQTFLLIFVLPFLLRYVLTQLIEAASPTAPGMLSTLVDALPTLVPVLWLWRVGVALHSRLPADVTVSAVYFHLGALYFALYILILIYTLGLVRESLSDGILPLGMLALLVPMHLFGTFCYLYVAYFLARSIISVDKRRTVTAGEYISPFIQVIFLPVGIWFIQPRLNKLSHQPTNT